VQGEGGSWKERPFRLASETKCIDLDEWHRGKEHPHLSVA